MEYKMKEVYFLRRESNSLSHADPVERSVGLRLESVCSAGAHD